MGMGGTEKWQHGDRGWGWGATLRPECLRRLTVVRVCLARLRLWAPGEYWGTPPTPSFYVNLCFLSTSVSLGLSLASVRGGHLPYQLNGGGPRHPQLPSSFYSVLSMGFLPYSSLPLAGSHVLSVCGASELPLLLPPPCSRTLSALAWPVPCGAPCSQGPTPASLPELGDPSCVSPPGVCRPLLALARGPRLSRGAVVVCSPLRLGFSGGGGVLLMALGPSLNVLAFLADRVEVGCVLVCSGGLRVPAWGLSHPRCPCRGSGAPSARPCTRLRGILCDVVPPSPRALSLCTCAGGLWRGEGG